jgi:hypothetical protein
VLETGYVQSFTIAAGRDMRAHAQTQDASPHWEFAAVSLNHLCQQLIRGPVLFISGAYTS